MIKNKGELKLAILHPKMKFFLENLVPEYPEDYTPTLEDIRARASVLTGEAEPVYRVEDRVIPGPESDIPIRIYTPEGKGPLPIVVYFHGGGFVYGDLETHDAVCRSIVNASQHIVVAVDYRLAPEHPFPAAPNDCYAAAKWVYENAAKLGGDQTRLSVAGDSAGGNLATVVCLMAKEKGGLAISKQLLIYPVTDDFEPEKYPSYKENGTGYFLTTDTMGLFHQLYIQDKAYRKHPYAAPLYAPNLSGLPKALVITAEYDPLRDEGELYANKLQESGVAVQLVREKGLIHGFFNLFSLMNASEDIKVIYEYIGAFLREN